MKTSERLLGMCVFVTSHHEQLSWRQLQLLLLLRVRGPMSQVELAAELDLTPSAITRSVDALSGRGRSDGKNKYSLKGWVETAHVRGDRRVKQVELTDSGKAWLSDLFEAMDK
jgi:DNA-binding MarR family transcriptional regulator